MSLKQKIQTKSVKYDGLQNEIRIKTVKYVSIREQVRLWIDQCEALQCEIGELEVELDSQNDNETVLCEACGKTGECEQFTHVDDGEYLFCVVCWEEMQHKINVGSENDFKLKEGYEIQLNAYDNQTLKTLKKVNKKVLCSNCQTQNE